MEGSGLLRKEAQGFDDLPTEVHVPEGVRIEGDESDGDGGEPTAAFEEKDVRKVAATPRGPRRERPREGYLVDFRDDSKTEVMNQELQTELAKASQKPPRPRR